MNQLLTQWPDVAEVRQKAKRDWERQQRSAIPLGERIGLTVPWWLVIVAAVFFLLSIPHTARTFDVITPGFGYAAPLGVEFGLLYTAFNRHKLGLKKAKPTRAAGVMEILLFLVAILVNGVGTLQAVADDAGLHEMSTLDVINSFGHLSAIRQAALILVPVAAIVIPIGTAAAGEGLAALFLEQRRDRDNLGDVWHTVAAEVEFYALRDAALGRGIEPPEANRWAAQITGYRPAGQFRTPVRPSVSGQSDGQRRHATGSGYTRHNDARTIVRDVLIADPTASDLSVRALAARTGVGKTTVADVLREWREIEPVGTPNGNGHDKPHD